MTAATLSPAWPTRDLVGSLARSSWGELAAEVGGVRVVLRAVVDLLPYRSGEGKITAGQIADAAGLSERWVRHCLQTLEALGLIEYRRGWLDQGRPVPGWIRVIKTRLVELIKRARNDGTAEQRRADRAAGLRDRLTSLRRSTQPAKKRKALSDRPELTSSPYPLRGEDTAPAYGRGADHHHHNTRKTTTMTTPSLCAHGYADRNNCQHCKGSANRARCAVCHRDYDACRRADKLAPNHDYQPATSKARA